MKQLPKKFAWLDQLTDTPKVWQEARRHYGVLESPGAANTPEIMGWAKEFGASGYYKADLVPWCGLFMCVPIGRSGYIVVPDPLAAISWLKFGNPVAKGQEMFCDVLVFSRPGGNHVGLYIAENKTHFLVYGGNTSDAVGFAWIEKTRLRQARRCPWKIGQPAAVRKYYQEINGDKVSTNEA